MTARPERHPVYLALLDDVLAHPQDDAPRLVLADWLEDSERPERAEFIRVQCEIAQRRKWGDCLGAEPPCECCPACREVMVPLLARERALWELRTDSDWIIPDIRNHDAGPSCVPSAIDAERFSQSKTRPLAIFRRGFADLVRATLSLWLEHGPALVRRQPIARVELTDLQAVRVMRGDGRWAWVFPPDARRGLHGRHLDCLYLHWPTEALALDALSANLLLLARETPCPPSEPA